MMASKRKIVSIHLLHRYMKHEGLRTNNRVLHRPRSFPVTVLWVVSFFPGEIYRQSRLLLLVMEALASGLIDPARTG